MAEKRNNGLPKRLEQLIREDIHQSRTKFSESGIEQKIFNRIGDGRRESRSPARWVLLPVSSLLVFAVIFLLPTRNRLDHPDSLFKHIQRALETVSQDSPGRGPDPVWERTPVQSSAESGSVEELSGMIGTAILTVEGASEIEITYNGNQDKEKLRSIRKGIRDLHNKKDYSELFSRIINKLTEG